jgi:hypothetical protein
MRNVEGSGGSGCDVVSLADGDCCGAGGDDGSGSVWFRCAKVAEVGEDLGKLEALHRVMRRPSLTSRRMRAVTNEAESLREYRKPLRKPRSGAVAGRVLLFVTLLATKTPE